MKEKNKFYRKFIPNQCANTIFDIDFDQLYENGKRYILTDVDNTLISYQESLPDEQTLTLRKQLASKGFFVYVISNNNGKRIAEFALAFDALGYVSWAHKPLKRGFKKSLKQMGKPDLSKVIAIGDQLMTDVFGANRMGIDVILVRPIKLKTEKWVTKLNRKMENKVLSKIKELDEDAYAKIINLKETTNG